MNLTKSKKDVKIMPSNNKNLHDGHRQRMFAKFEAASVDDLPDHELLEMLLFYSIPRANTNETAHELINRFGSLGRVFGADSLTLTSVDNVGDRSAALIRLVYAIMRRCEINKLAEASGRDAKYMKTLDDVARFLIPHFSYLAEERVAMVSLDDKYKLIDFRFLDTGNQASVYVDMKKIADVLSSVKPAFFYLAHNHPGGYAKPSTEDIDFTFKARTWIHPFGAQMLDHLIIADDGYEPIFKHVERSR